MLNKSEEFKDCGLVIPDNTGILTNAFSAEEEIGWEVFRHWQSEQNG